MPTIRPLLALAALLAAASAVPAAARVARPVELTDTTVVTATHSGYVDVVLTDDVRLSPRTEGNPDIRISGAGRLVGFWLSRGDTLYAGNDGVSALRLPAFLGGRVHTDGTTTPTGRCTAYPSEDLPLHEDCSHLPAPQAILLHEGRYRLTVLTDGSPLRITLSLHGLDDGATTVSPAHNLASLQKPLPARESVQDKLVTFGATASLPGSALGFVMSKATEKSRTATFREASTCERRDDGDAPALGYGPHCPDGSGGSYEYQLNLGPQSLGGIGGFVSAGDDSGHIGLGGSWGNSDGVTLGPTLGAWLQLP